MEKPLKHQRRLGLLHYMNAPGKLCHIKGNCVFIDPIVLHSCRTATLDFFDLAESKVAVFLCSILTSDGVPFCFGKNSFP